MKQFLLTLLLLVTALSGCTDDTDDHGDGCEDAADHDACHDQMDGGMGGGTGGTGGTGGGNGTGGSMTPRQVIDVEISWNGAYRVNGAYSQDTLTVPANSTVNLTFINNDPAFGHDFVVEGIDGAATAVLGACTQAPCKSETITFDVGSPVATKFFCAVPGHRDGGMEGDFIVA